MYIDRFLNHTIDFHYLDQILKNKGIPHSNKQKRRTSKPL